MPISSLAQKREMKSATQIEKKSFPKILTQAPLVKRLVLRLNVVQKIVIGKNFFNCQSLHISNF